MHTVKYCAGWRGASKLKWTAKINVTLKKAVLDPQGAAVERSLHALGYDRAGNVRVGKYIELSLEAESAEKAKEQAREMSVRLFSNPVIEDFNLELQVAGE